MDLMTVRGGTPEGKLQLRSERRGRDKHASEREEHMQGLSEEREHMLTGSC